MINTGTETGFILAFYEPLSDLKETFDVIQGSSREEVLEVFESRTNELKVLSFKHQ